MSDQPKVKEYTNGTVTIVWQADKCIHSGKCVNGLPEVFNAKARPWINAKGSSTEAIIAQVKHCPSGALSYYMNGTASRTEEGIQQAETVVEVTPNGPLMISGDVKIKHADGTETVQKKMAAFCRCGASSKKPFCDGSHRKVGFEG